MIVDVGAWTNLAGQNWVRAMAEKAIKAGYKPGQTKMPRPLVVQGVGHGTQTAIWKAELPVAIQGNKGEAQHHTYSAPTLTGSGEHMPALLGLRSISENKGVLQTEKGKECLTFPGPGGYKIEWAPGAVHMKLENAPSGHLVVPCDDFASIPNTSGGLAPQGMHLHATSDEGPLTREPMEPPNNE